VSPAGSARTSSGLPGHEDRAQRPSPTPATGERADPPVAATLFPPCAPSRKILRQLDVPGSDPAAARRAICEIARRTLFRTLSPDRERICARAGPARRAPSRARTYGRSRGFNPTAANHVCPRSHSSSAHFLNPTPGSAESGTASLSRVPRHKREREHDGGRGYRDSTVGLRLSGPRDRWERVSINRSRSVSTVRKRVATDSGASAVRLEQP
jgi:hypothetical protein